MTDLLDNDFTASATATPRQFFDRLNQTYDALCKNFDNDDITLRFFDSSDIDPPFDYDSYKLTETTFAITVDSPDYQIIYFYDTVLNVSYDTESNTTVDNPTDTYLNYHHFIADFIDYYLRQLITVS